MMNRIPRTVQVGELLTAASEAAAQHGADPREVSRLAMLAATNRLRLHDPVTSRQGVGDGASSIRLPVSRRAFGAN
jgi:hypothetical protein